MSWETVWIVWLAVASVSFGVLEWVTIRKGQTLSENLRRWLGVEPRKPWRKVGIPAFAAVVLGFAAWFIPHIVG